MTHEEFDKWYSENFSWSQQWHDENDTDADGLTVNQRIQLRRRQEAVRGETAKRPRCGSHCLPHANIAEQRPASHVGYRRPMPALLRFQPPVFWRLGVTENFGG